MFRKLIRSISISKPNFKPYASEVLTCYLVQSNEPPWTAFFVRQVDVWNDQWGKSHFNWKAGSSNYHVLRTGCFPYIKYHCSKNKEQSLAVEDAFFRTVKVLNLGIGTLAYGMAATVLAQHREEVHTPNGKVTIFFWYPEDKGSLY